jgi:hypothetical protein
MQNSLAVTLLVDDISLSLRPIGCEIKNWLTDNSFKSRLIALAEFCKRITNSFHHPCTTLPVGHTGTSS